MYNQLKQMLYQAGQGVMINCIIKRQYGEYFANNHTMKCKKGMKMSKLFMNTRGEACLI